MQLAGAGGDKACLWSRKRPYRGKEGRQIRHPLRVALFEMAAGDVKGAGKGGVEEPKSQIHELPTLYCLW